MYEMTTLILTLRSYVSNVTLFVNMPHFRMMCFVIYTEPAEDTQ